jgi:proteasome lid subunit RPN8/RPN11
MDQFFQPKNVERPSVMWRMRPQRDERFVCFGPDHDGFEAYLHRDVLEFMRQETRCWSPKETIGMLAGRPCKDPKGPFTIVSAAEGGLFDEIDATPGHVYLSASGSSQVRQRLECDHPTLELVGWYHSHPHSPAVFSMVDQTNQSTWPNSHHIGVVVSGLSRGSFSGEQLVTVYRGPEAVELPRHELAIEAITRTHQRSQESAFLGDCAVFGHRNPLSSAPGQRGSPGHQQGQRESGAAVPAAAPKQAPSTLASPIRWGAAIVCCLLVALLGYSVYQTGQRDGRQTAELTLDRPLQNIHQLLTQLDSRLTALHERHQAHADKAQEQVQDLRQGLRSVEEQLRLGQDRKKSRMRSTDYLENSQAVFMHLSMP